MPAPDAAPAPAALPPEFAPSHYVERVSLATGEPIPGEVKPEELLVQSHRDHHVLDVYLRFVVSKLVQATGEPELVGAGVKGIKKLGEKAVDLFTKLTGGVAEKEKVAEALLGLRTKEYYFRLMKPALAAEDVKKRVDELKKQAGAKLAAVSREGRPGVRVLLTGGTGFIGKEFIWQVAGDEDVAEVVVLIRPKEVRDRKTKQVVKVLTPSDRGADLLKEIGLDEHPARAKFRFADGDIERPRLGLAEDELARLRKTVTHVVHSAASVAFDDPYDVSFRANVLGCLNALETSLDLQRAEGSPFVAHLSIETSYIHGRQRKEQAREDDVVFPRNYYNNYYELTKAFASLETDRFMLEKGLRIVQLCPAIVIGDSRTGNNRGDTKVVNAPVNLFGRTKLATGVATARGPLADRAKAWVLGRVASIFPGDPSAELNIVPVDRVVMGIVAALKTGKAIGERIHLGTDNRVTAETLTRIVREEVGVNVRLAEPTVHRTVTTPVIGGVLERLGQDKLAKALGTLGSIFGGYGEWGQPVHEVARDAYILGLPLPRPNTEHALRMLTRHNRHVQEFGRIRDPHEIAERERRWHEWILDLEKRRGEPVGAMSAEEFRRALEADLDPRTLKRRKASTGRGPS